MILKRGKEKIIYFILLFLLSIVFSTYYYGIQKGFIPNSENLASIWVAYHNVYANEALDSSLWIKICEIAVSLWGFSYKTLRMVNAFMYFLITLFALDLAIRKKEWTIRWYAIPMYMLFMVMMHHGDSVYFGQLTGQVYQYPFDQHMLAHFAAIFCVWIVYQIDSSLKYRLMKYAITSIVMLVFAMITDLLYFVTFLIPFVVVLVCKYIKKDKIIIAGIAMGFMGIGICRFLAQYIPFFSAFFSGSTERYSSGHVYGVTNFEDVTNLVRNFLNYIGGLSGLFNCDFSGTSVQNLNFFLYFVRIVFLCLIFYYVFCAIKKIIFFREIANMAEVIMALGIVLLSFFFIFTSHGNSIIQMRYLVMILPYGTILLCWHIDDFSKVFNLPSLNNKGILFGVIFFIVFASHDYRWGHEKTDEAWNQEYQYVAQLVEENNLHEGIASMWSFANVSAVCEGEHILSWGVYNSNTMTMELVHPLKTQYFYDYVLLGKDGLNSMEASLELLEGSYGKADEIIETNHYYLMIYRNGLNIQ